MSSTKASLSILNTSLFLVRFGSNLLDQSNMLFTLTPKRFAVATKVKPSFSRIDNTFFRKSLEYVIQKSITKLHYFSYIYDEKNNIIIEAALPGLKSEEIEVNLNKGVLWVKGEKKEEATDKNKKFYKKSIRSFSYSVALPEQVDESQEPEASYKDGILKISFQKAKDSKAKRITIKNKID